MRNYQKKLDDSVIIPPDELRCRTTDGRKWRCKNRIADTGLKWCEKHHNMAMDYKIKASLRYAEKKNKKLVQTETSVEEKKKNGNEGSNDFNGGLEKSDLEVECKEKRTRKRKIHYGCCVEPRVSDRLKQKKKQKMILDDLHLTVDETTIQQTIDHDAASYRFPDCPPGFTRKRSSMKAEGTEIIETHSNRCYEELNSSAESTSREIELEKLLGRYGSKCLELSIEFEKKRKECLDIQGKVFDLECRKSVVEDECKQLKRRQERTTDSLIARLQQDQKVLCQREERTHERVVHLEEELRKVYTELEHGKRRAEDEVEVWKKKFCDLETRVLNIEKVVQFQDVQNQNVVSIEA